MFVGMDDIALSLISLFRVRRNILVHTEKDRNMQEHMIQSKHTGSHQQVFHLLSSHPSRPSHNSPNNTQIFL